MILPSQEGPLTAEQLHQALRLAGYGTPAELATWLNNHGYTGFTPGDSHATMLIYLVRRLSQPNLTVFTSHLVEAQS